MLLKFFRIIILFVCFNTHVTYAYDKYLCICAIFQNEAPYLKEWIEYHRLLGVEHFYLYNNNSNDHYKEVLSKYIKKKVVTLIDWPSSINENWPVLVQETAYNDCIKKVKNKTHWLAIIDIDEFIVPMMTDSIPKLLRNYEGAGGVQIFWQFYGTSNIYQIPENKTLTESLLWKAPKDHNCNYNCKTICIPSRVEKFYVHLASYKGPWYGLFPHGTRGGPMQPIHIDIVRINHYWTRDEKYLREKKLPRKQIWGNGVQHTEEQVQLFIREFNQEIDGCILRFVPALKAKLGKN